MENSITGGGIERPFPAGDLNRACRNTWVEPRQCRGCNSVSSVPPNMTIAVRAPTYFPPLSETSLFAHVDHFVLADTFRFRRQSFQNRSKLRNAPGTHWITIPLFGNPEGAPLHEVEVETKGRWQEKHWRSFLYDYRSTMYFSHFQDVLRSFYDTTWTRLANCTCRSVERQAALFGLSTTLTRASDLDGAPDSVRGIVDAVGADTLVVPQQADVVSTAAPRIQSFAFRHPTYHQNFEGFENGATALDLLFNYGPEARRIATEAGTLLQEESP